MVTAPDEARPQHRQVPAVLLREAAGDALLPPFGDRVAVAFVEIWNGLDGRALVEGAAAGAPVVDREAARQDHPPARSASHGVEQALGSDHGASELEVLAARHHRRQVHQHISAVEGALEVTGGPQIGSEDLDGGWPFETLHGRGRPDESANLVPTRDKRRDDMPAEEAVGPGDQRPHGCWLSGLRASTRRFTSTIWCSPTGRADPSPSERYVRPSSSNRPS